MEFKISDSSPTRSSHMIKKLFSRKKPRGGERREKSRGYLKMEEIGRRR